MKNTIKWKAVQRIAGLIALIAVIGFSMASCASTPAGEADSALNGTWVASGEEWTFNNGKHEYSLEGSRLWRGTYTTSNNSIRLNITEFNGGHPKFADSGLTSKWYSRSDFANRSSEQLDEVFPTLSGRYTVSSTSLTLTVQGATSTYSKNRSQTQTQSQSQAARYMLVNTDTLNVRSGPSADNSVVGQLARNTRVEVIDRSAGTWWKIKAGTIEGYVNSTLLRGE